MALAASLSSNSDGTDAKWLALGRDPAWSPDDARIAFDGEGGIFVTDSDGSGTPQKLLGDDAELPRPAWYDATSYDPGWVGLPSWSPDGQNIAFTRGDPFRHSWGVERNAYVMNVDGSAPRLLGAGCAIKPPGQGLLPCPAESPAWSPTGALIAVATYDHNATTGHLDPVLAGVGGNSWDMKQVLYHGYKNYVGHPDWSPDGWHIVFDQLASAAPGDLRGSRIFVLTALTGAVHQLIPDIVNPVLRSYGDSDPVWSSMYIGWDY